MAWLDGLLDGNTSDPHAPGNGGWLGPLANANAAPASQDPSLLDRLTAGATNLTTGGNPLAGLLNAVNGLATGQRTDVLGATLAQQIAVRQALTAAGVPSPVATAAAMSPEVLKTVAPQLYSKPQPHKLKDAYGAERIVFADPGRQTVTDPAAGTGGAAARGMNVLAPGVTRYDAGLPAEAWLAQFAPEMQAAIKAHVAAGTADADARRLAIANAARPFAQHYARKIADAASGGTPAPERKSAATE